jgi:transcriptional regulator with XRE-family HTH domain
MTSSKDLVNALKAELRRAGMTYAELARRLGMAESSIKRIFSRADMPLSRIDQVLAVLGLDFADLAARLLRTAPQRKELTLQQEKPWSPTAGCCWWRSACSASGPSSRSLPPTG